jgi:hypothetical protein
MKVNVQTDQLLQLKQSKWLPWYWQLLLWPTVLFMLIIPAVGQESKLTCRKAEGKCQLESQGYKAEGNKTISLDNIQKIDLVATNDESTSSTAQLVIVNKDGSKVNVGKTESYETLDDTASKLSWFLESSTAQFIELSASDIWATRLVGLMGLGAGFWVFWRGGKRVVTFDQNRQLCTVESQRLWQKKGTDYPLTEIEGIELVNSFKPVGYNMTMKNRSGLDVVLNDKVLPVSKGLESEQVVNKVRGFLNLKAPNPAPQTAVAYPQPMGKWDGHKTSTHEVEGENGEKYWMEVYVLYRSLDNGVVDANIPTSHELYPELAETWSRQESSIQEVPDDDGKIHRVEDYVLYRYFTYQEEQNA